MNNLIKLLACSLAILVITACTMPKVKRSWSKPGSTPGEFERVSAECENDPGMTGLKGYASYQVCMKKHGWYLIEEPEQ